MTETHDIRVSARTAQLLASDDTDDGPWRFSGVAVAAGDILHMDDGTPVLFTEEELRVAAETQTDEPLTVDHPRDDDGRPQYPPPTDETVGKVQRAGWLDDVEGVGYEATTHDETIGKGVQAGSYEVSVHSTFKLGEQDPETGAYRAKNVQFRDLSVVSKGDSPSNTVQWGPNQALASYTRSADIGEKLAASDAGGGDTPSDETQGLVRSAVRGAVEGVRGLGDGVAEAAAEAEESDGDEPAEPGPDADNSDMTDPDDPKNGGEDPGAGGGGEERGKTLADMTVDELGETLQEQGFVTEDDADQIVEQATAQAEKGEMVDEIIAKSDDFDEEDREGLMASSDSLVEKEHKRVRGEATAQLPGASGAAATLTAGADDDAVDEYGTGVKED